MSNLRTLKDIEHLRISQGRGMGKSGATDVSTMVLKQEAIKHIKAIRNGEITNSTGNRLRTLEIGIVGWIKHFFNITEEDLK